MLIRILVVLASIVLVAAVIIIIKRKKENVKRIYRAAGNILKNEYLDHSLHNPYISANAANQMPSQRKLMVYFRSIGAKPAKEYVFDPESVIGIGRARSNNSIILSEAIVSSEHCKVYLKNGQIVLQDCGSSNGTAIRRRSRTYVIEPYKEAVLFSGDIIIIGSTRLEIKIFDYDMVWM